MHYPITSKQWLEFKKWREDEIEKIKSSSRYKRLKSAEEENNSRGVHIFKKSFCPMLAMRLSGLETFLFRDIPDETPENCYRWLLDNNKIV
jgi:hypothetical protein